MNLTVHANIYNIYVKKVISLLDLKVIFTYFSCWSDIPKKLGAKGQQGDAVDTSLKPRCLDARKRISREKGRLNIAYISPAPAPSPQIPFVCHLNDIPRVPVNVVCKASILLSCNYVGSPSVRRLCALAPALYNLYTDGYFTISRQRMEPRTMGTRILFFPPRLSEVLVQVHTKM